MKSRLNNMFTSPQIIPAGVRSLVATLASGLCALLLVAPQAFAATFSFSTGNPDGLMATATRPGPTNGVDQETESGDDFILTNEVQISTASFTGLVPLGVLTSDVSRVVVEIYRVFPNDSDTNRTINVPTRANSPSDVALDSRNSSGGDLNFTVLNVAIAVAAGLLAWLVHARRRRLAALRRSFDDTRPGLVARTHPPDADRDAA